MFGSSSEKTGEIVELLKYLKWDQASVCHGYRRPWWSQLKRKDWKIKLIIGTKDFYFDVTAIRLIMLYLVFFFLTALWNVLLATWRFEQVIERNLPSICGDMTRLLIDKCTKLFQMQMVEITWIIVAIFF